MKLLIGRTSRRILALFLTVVSVFAAFGLRTSTTRTVRATEAEPTATATAGYVKVTSAPADWSGRYLIVYEAGNLAFNGSLTTLDAVGNSVAVTITDGVISDDFSANEFTIATVEGGYSVASASGKYIGRNSASNGMDVATTEKINTITFNEGTVAIVGVSGYTLQYYNSGTSSRFRYYGAGKQQPISLYKYVDDINSVCEHTWETEPYKVTAAACTVAGEAVYKCTKCAEEKAELIAATGHNFVKGVCTNADCGATQSVYALVTDVVDLEIDDQIIIVAKDSAVAISTNQKENNRGEVAIVKNESLAIVEDATTQAITLTAGTKDNTFAFYTGDGYLYAASSKSYYLRTEESLSDNGSWTIAISADGVATVVAQGANTNNVLRHNSGSELFSAYKDSESQSDIAIYKLVGSAQNFYALTEEFSAMATDASFKLGYTDGEVTSAKLRFGTTMSEALCESLNGMGAVYGFDVTSGDDARDIYDETWKPASTNGGAQYKFSIVIGDFNEDWSKQFTAKVYVQIGGVKYYTQAVTYSVNSLATVYKATETDPAILAILNVLEGGVA